MKTKIFKILIKMKIKNLMKKLFPINYKLNNRILTKNINIKNVIIATYQINSKFGFNLIRVNIIIVLSVC